jgi:hypothetical protein
MAVDQVKCDRLLGIFREVPPHKELDTDRIPPLKY